MPGPVQPSGVAAAKVLLEIDGTIAAYERELAKAPGITDVQARKMAESMRRQYYVKQAKEAAGLTDTIEKEAAKQAEAAERAAEDMRRAFEEANRDAARAAEEASRKARQSAEDSQRAWERSSDKLKGGAEKFASFMGGPLGDMADLGLDLADTMTGTAGAIGTAGASAGAAAATFGALAIGAKALVGAAIDARDRLKEVGLASTLPPEALARLADYEQASTDLSREIDRLTVDIGSELAPALAYVADTTAEVIRWWRELREEAEDLPVPLERAAKGFTALGEVAKGVASLSLTYWIGKSREAREEQQKFIDSVKTQADAFEAEHQRIFELAQQRKESAEQFVGPILDDAELLAARDAAAKEKAAEAARKAAEAAREHAAAVREQAQEEKSFRAAVKATGEEQKRTAALAAGADRERIVAAEAARQAEIDGMLRVAKLREELDAKRLADALAMDGELQQIMQARMQQQAAADEARLSASLRGFGQISQAIEMLAEQQAEGGEKGARAAFAISKAAALSQIGIETALAIAEANPNPIAMAGAFAVGAVQAGIVAAASPPEFPGGGVVGADVLRRRGYGMSQDHGMIGASPGEGVVNRRGMQTLGEDGLRTLNQGGGGMGPITVIHQYTHRALNAIVADNLKTDSPLAKAIAKQRKPGHSRRA